MFNKIIQILKINIIFCKKILIYLILFTFTIIAPSYAQNLNLIQDAEIETTLLKWIKPILIKAKLNPESIKIFIVNDDSINAFVAGGQNIFINTGLITKANDHNALIGVMAHEIGHISGGHLIKTNKAINRAQNTAIIATIITAGLMAISHANDTDIKGISKLATIGPSLAERNFFKFSRDNEKFADSAAIRYLREVNRPLTPLANLLNEIGKQELLHENRQDPYLRTHPIFRERINHIFNEANINNEKSIVIPKSEKIEYKRIVAKIVAFTTAPGKTLLLYPKNNLSIEARYARAIAYLRLSNFKKGTKEISTLIKENNNDPFFPELLGQMLFENGKIYESIKMYKKSNQLLPNNPIILLALSKSQVEYGEEIEIINAKKNLKTILQNHPKNIAAWQLLSITEARLNNIELAQLYSAEAYFLLNDYNLAINFAKKSRLLFEKNSPNDIRAQDIIYFSNERIKLLQQKN